MITQSTNDIRNLSFEELRDYLVGIGEKPFRAEQIFDWIYKKTVEHIDDMKNLPVALRERLKADFVMPPQTVARQDVSVDGTTKFLFDLHDKEKIETVVIPTATRTTVCVSTQAGCKFGCRFCASGIGGWIRNLSTAEIVAQVLHAKRYAGEERPLSHLVFMGIGEPLDNYDNLMKAIHLINGEKGINIAARRITVSTSGVVPKMRQLAEQDLQIELAVSLHGFDNASRNVLMPVNKKYPIEDLVETCRYYIQNKKRQITFEYIMIKDVTCTPEAAKKLAALFKGLICKMNLIPYNKVAEFPHECPSKAEMERFKADLDRNNIHATIRTPRGRDVAAACGQLRHSAKSEA